MARASDGMAARVLWGAAAGAVGTTALNVVSYGDMLVRGRAASDVPAQAAGRLAERLGLADQIFGSDEAKAAPRREAAGALLGYATGVGVGVAYGFMRGRRDSAHPLGAAVGLGLTAMAAADGPIAFLGVSDPRTWSAADWLADLVPHLAYGLATAATFAARR